jgi:hypothetical protein
VERTENGAGWPRTLAGALGSPALSGNSALETPSNTLIAQRAEPLAVIAVVGARASKNTLEARDINTSTPAA